MCEYKNLPEWQSHGVSWRQVDNKVDQYPRLTVKCLGLHGRWVVEVTVKYEPEGGVKVLSRPSSLCHPYGSPSSCTATCLRGVCVILYFFTQPRYAPVFRRARVFSSPHHPGHANRMQRSCFWRSFWNNGAQCILGTPLGEGWVWAAWKRGTGGAPCASMLYRRTTMARS